MKEKCKAVRAPLDVGLALAVLAELPQAFTDCVKLGYFADAVAKAAAGGGKSGAK